MTSLLIMSFLKQHWRKLAAAAGILALCAISFGFGRFGVAERVQFKEVVKTQTVEVEKKVYVDRVVEKKVYVAAEQKNVHRVTHEVRHADGSIETTKTEDIAAKKDVKATDDRAETKTEVVVKYVDRVIEKRVDVVKEKPLPDWRVGPLLGLNGPALPGLLSGEAFDPLKHLALGAVVERRVLGPISAGAWGLSSGQVGLTVTLEF